MNRFAIFNLAIKTKFIRRVLIFYVSSSLKIHEETSSVLPVYPAGENFFEKL